MRSACSVLVAVTALLTACRIDDTRYVLPGDGDGGVDGGDGSVGPDATDAPPAGALEVSPSTPIELLEGNSTTVAVRLTAAPAANVTVTISSPEPSIRFVPSTVMFTPDNFSSQIVSVISDQDDDATGVTTTAAFNAGAAGVVNLATTITDDDLLRLFVAPTSVTVLENTSTTVQVSLTAKPTGTVAVVPTVADGMVATVMPASLSFTTGDWDQLKTVTITAQPDVNTTSDTTTVTLTPTMGLPPETVAVTTTDDDTLNIAVTPGAVNGAEGGTTSQALSVRLTVQPPGMVTVSLTSNDPAVARPRVASLTFTTANFATPQTVPVDLPEDVDHTDDAAVITAASAGIPDVPVNVTVRDNDTQVIIAPLSVTMTEGEIDRAIAVSLTHAPDSAEMVDIGPAGPITIDRTQLTFTSTNYATPQIVRVSASHDNNLAVGMATLSFTSADAPAPATTTITINDDDVQTIVAPPAATLDEGGMTMVPVHLGFEPPTGTTVTVSLIGLPPSVTATPSSLSFTSSDWDDDHPVTLMASADVNTSTETGTLRLNGGGAMRDVSVTVRDTTVTGLTVTPTTANVNEGGSTTLTLRLTADPSPGTVSVSAVSSNPMAVSVSPGPYVLTGTNWQTGVPVLVSAMEDANAASEMAVVSFTASASLNASSTITTIDNDTLALQVSPTTLTIPEDDVGSIDVTMTGPPAGTVTVAVSAGLGLQIVGGSTLVFDADNYADPHIVAIKSLRDDDRTTNMSNVLLSPDTTVPNRTVMVMQSPDDTIWIGRFPPAGTGGVTPTMPTAWAATTINSSGSATPIPTCLALDAFISNPQSSGSFSAGLYGTLISTPGPAVHVIPRINTTSIGLHRHNLDGVEVCAGMGTHYVALGPSSMAPPPPTFAIQAQPVQQCSGSGSSLGSTFPVPTNCASGPPAVAYFVVHATMTCTCFDPPNKR